METSSDVEFMPPPTAIRTPEKNGALQKMANFREENSDVISSSPLQQQTLSDIWKNCVGNLCGHLAEIEAQWTKKWEDLQHKEEEELKNLTLVAKEAEDLNEACTIQIKELHSSLLNLASSFQG